MEETEVQCEVVGDNYIVNCDSDSEFIQEIIVELDSSDDDFPHTYSVKTENQVENSTAIENIPADPVQDDADQISREDKRDLDKINTFYGEEAVPCCTSNCNKLIPKEIALEHRYQFMELDKAEQDVFILSYIQAHRQLPNLENQYAKRARRGKMRLANKEHIMKYDIVYYFAAFVVCQKFFFFIHEIGKKRFRNLLTHYKKNGISPRIHQNRDKVPKRANVLTASDVNSVIVFVKSFAQQFVRSSKRKTNQKIRIPPSETAISVYRKYREFLNTVPHTHVMGQSSFRKIWKKYLPYITIAKPMYTGRIVVPTVNDPQNDAAED